MLTLAVMEDVAANVMVHAKDHAEHNAKIIARLPAQEVAKTPAEGHARVVVTHAMDRAKDIVEEQLIIDTTRFRVFKSRPIRHANYKTMIPQSKYNNYEKSFSNINITSTITCIL